MISQYFGSITMVLKFPLTSAASAKGLERYSGFPLVPPGDGGREGGLLLGAVPPEGVGERNARGLLRPDNMFRTKESWSDECCVSRGDGW